MALANAKAVKYGVPPHIGRSVIQHESGWNQAARSPVGAIGVMQLMPGTARSLGVDPTNAAQNIDGGMRYLGHLFTSFKGNAKLALAAYNAGPAAVTHYGGVPPYAETQRYVAAVLASAGGGGAVAPGAVAPVVPAATKSSTAPAVSSAYAQLRDQALQDIAFGRKSPLEALQSLPLSATQTVGTQGDSSATSGSSSASSVSFKGGKVTLAKGADRAGVKTSQALLDFAARVSAVARKALVIATGSNHSEYTVDGNVSDHWHGDAGDIPATGAELIHLGRSALVAAGADPAWANKQTGGLYNVHGHQIIFNTHKGGDHTNHLHISASESAGKV